MKKNQFPLLVLLYACCLSAAVLLAGCGGSSGGTEMDNPPPRLNIAEIAPTDTTVSRIRLGQSISPDGKKMVYFEGIIRKGYAVYNSQNMYEDIGVYLADIGGENAKLIARVASDGGLSSGYYGDGYYREFYYRPSDDQLRDQNLVVWSPQGNRVYFPAFDILKGNSSEKYNYLNLESQIFKKVDMKNLYIYPDYQSINDNDQINFYNSQDETIKSFNAETGNLKILFSIKSYDKIYQSDAQIIRVSTPILSPDMNRVAFFVQYCEPTLQDYLSQTRAKSGESYGAITDQILTSKGQSRLYVMNLDGTGLTQVDSTFGLSFGDRISWSPNSKKIAYSVPDKNTYHPRIQITNADGTNPVQIQQSNEVSLTFFGWLPNSQQIRVVQWQGNTHGEALKSTQILTINAN
jgi:hypothetical protein